MTNPDPALHTQILLRDWANICELYARAIDGDTSPETVEEAERLIKKLNNMRIALTYVLATRRSP